MTMLRPGRWIIAASRFMRWFLAVRANVKLDFVFVGEGVATGRATATDTFSAIRQAERSEGTEADAVSEADRALPRLRPKGLDDVGDRQHAGPA